MRARRLRLERAAAAEVSWTRRRLAKVCRRFGTTVRVAPDGDLLVEAR